MAAGLSGIGSSSLPLAGASVALAADENAYGFFKHPDMFKRCLALSGVYDVRRFMDGDYNDNFYFNNPMDYVANLNDPWYLQHLASCDIRLATGNGPYEDSGPTYRFSELLKAKGIRHTVDDWGPEGGHDWPYWKKQMNEYISRLN